MKVCNCTENDALSLAFYLYQLCADINDFESHEECQILYNALVNRLNLVNHADAVLNAMLYKLEKIKQLTPVEVSERYIHPFAMRGKLKTNYREDESIFENCGNWESNTHRDVNLIRALFCSNKNNFARIVALTFFTKPGCYDDKNVPLPNRVPVPAKIKKALDDVSSVQFAVDTLKLSEDEAKVLQVAFRTQSIKELYAVCNDFFRNDDFTRFDMYSKCSGKSQKEIRMF